MDLNNWKIKKKSSTHRYTYENRNKNYAFTKKNIKWV